MSKRFLIAGAAAGIAALAYACTILDITEVPVVLVEVHPPSVTILEGENQRLTAKAKDGLGNDLPIGAVTWSSDAPSIFSIDNTGNGEALAAGQATIWATLDGTRGSADVSVGIGPRIFVGEPWLLFFLNLGGTAPDPIGLQITNGGGGSMGGISAAVQYPEGGTAGWVSLALASTSAPSTLTVSIPLGLLEEGVHDAILVLASPDARNSPVTVPVRAVVTLDQPIIGLGPRALDFQAEAPAGPPTPQAVQVTNLGGGALLDLQAVPLYFGVGGWLSANLSETTAPTELLVQPDPSGLLPGTYTAEVRIMGPGALNTPQAVDVTFTVEVGPVSPTHSTATVPDGTAGLPTRIVVQARDGGGNPLSSGGETVLVTVSGDNNAGALTVTDQTIGTYTATYTPTTAGTDYVAITIDGTPVSGSPFTSTVDVGAVSPSHSTATVPPGSAGSATSIVVRARDAYNNPLSSGGERVAVTVSGDNNAGTLTVTDPGDGTYTASYTPTTAGADYVAITMNGIPISGSPFTSTIGAGAVSPVHSTATVPDGTAGLPTDIVIQARDGSGNLVSSGGETVVVTVSGDNNAGAVPVTDQTNGTYTATYTPTTVGTDYVAITINGTPISGSPFPSTVDLGAVSPARSTATVPDGSAGLETGIIVQARDAYHNPLSSGGETVVVTVSGDNNAGALTVTDQADGTYTASYTPTMAGADYVAITMNDIPISGSPFTSAVGAGAVSPAHSTATVPAGSTGSATSIVVQARDAYDNPLSSGGETVVVTVSGDNNAGVLTVTDQADGTYTATYTPTTPGADIVAITMNDTPISGSPFTSTVDVGPVSPAHSTATVPDGKEKNPTNIEIQARDAYGNPLTVGGDIVVVTVTGKNPTGPMTATDLGDGTYTATYTPEKRGDDEVFITINGIPIAGSPFKSKVK